MVNAVANAVVKAVFGGCTPHPHASVWSILSGHTLLSFCLCLFHRLMGNFLARHVMPVRPVGLGMVSGSLKHLARSNWVICGSGSSCPEFSPLSAVTGTSPEILKSSYFNSVMVTVTTTFKVALQVRWRNGCLQREGYIDRPLIHAQ